MQAAAHLQIIQHCLSDLLTPHWPSLSINDKHTDDDDDTCVDWKKYIFVMKYDKNSVSPQLTWNRLPEVFFLTGPPPPPLKIPSTKKLI